MIIKQFDPEIIAKTKADIIAAEEALLAAEHDRWIADEALLAMENDRTTTKEAYSAVVDNRMIAENAYFAALAVLMVAKEALSVARDAKFEADWPYHFDLTESASWNEIRGAFRKTREVYAKDESEGARIAVPEIKMWLDENVGRDGYAVHDNYMIGFRDVNHGFHFRMRWM
ncbi:hypothetical protein [Methylobacterium longum]|uniref:Uncharacterized protein n=1 Tax=Methylobacterium longum TaxID=767694 RepID=A0ABT8AR44_9HYPH|nr:hypothetical protein [Methylobacterium longum]MDN3572378.1 hypothetical protein [Methylobacterium longum]GJE09479.1 hypothetical protein FOHLNKBM_0503 [Methylobacterium longum]